MPRLVAALFLAWCLGGAPLAAQTLKIYQIDVEQADAALFVMPNGKTLLVDSGRNGDGRRIRNVMARAGVMQIDAFVNTHYHEDHFGGIDDLVNLGVPVLEAYDRGDKSCCLSAAKKAEKSFRDYQRAVGERARPLRPGDAIDLDPLVTITTLAAGGDVANERNPVFGRTENDMSIALLVDFLGFRAFYGGDIEAATEGRIAAHHLAVDVDVYKADHHGSHTSSSMVLMTDLQPSLVVISNGSDAGYLHPRQVTLATYAALRSAPTVIQTNKCRQPVPCANAADAFIADPETIDEDGTIEIDVDAASASYRVSYAQTALMFAVKAAPSRGGDLDEP